MKDQPASHYKQSQKGVESFHYLGSVVEQSTKLAVMEVKREARHSVQNERA